jgi:hypothetical protein
MDPLLLKVKLNVVISQVKTPGGRRQECLFSLSPSAGKNPFFLRA